MWPVDAYHGIFLDLFASGGAVVLTTCPGCGTSHLSDGPDVSLDGGHTWYPVHGLPPAPVAVTRVVVSGRRLLVDASTGDQTAWYARRLPQGTRRPLPTPPLASAPAGGPAGRPA